MMSWLALLIILLMIFPQFEMSPMAIYLDDGDASEIFGSQGTKEKKQLNWDQEEDQDTNMDQWQADACMQDSQMGICPAENPHDVKYEKGSCGKYPKKNNKDEDDDEDADPGAISDDDDDDDDDDEDDGDDECSAEGSDIHLDDKALVNRINCLMGSLHKHTKAMVDNLKILESQLSPKKNSAYRKNTNLGRKSPGKPIDKWSRNSDFYGEHDPSAQEKCIAQDNVEPQAYYQAQSQLTRDDHRLLVPPLLQLFHGPPSLQSHFKSSQDGPQLNSRFWMPFGQERQEALVKSEPEEKTHLRYEEYEARLRRLMDNRDAIEKNVMRIMRPIH